jgi:hypothetical protein
MQFFDACMAVCRIVGSRIKPDEHAHAVDLTCTEALPVFDNPKNVVIAESSQSAANRDKSVGTLPLRPSAWNLRGDERGASDQPYAAADTLSVGCLIGFAGARAISAAPITMKTATPSSSRRAMKLRYA